MEKKKRTTLVNFIKNMWPWLIGIVIGNVFSLYAVLFNNHLSRCFSAVGIVISLFVTIIYTYIVYNTKDNIDCGTY